MVGRGSTCRSAVHVAYLLLVLSRVFVTIGLTM